MDDILISQIYIFEMFATWEMFLSLCGMKTSFFLFVFFVIPQ